MNSATRLVDALALMGSMNDVIKDTHGNVSCLAPGGVIWIKPSGMPYGQITQDDVCSLAIIDGHTLGPSKRKPSVDTPHHLSIYQRHPWVGAICHTHSPHVVAYAISAVELECLCTEHADYFGGPIRILPYRDLDKWGHEVMLERSDRAILLGNHGALTFADDPIEAVKLAAALENVAQKNFLAYTLSEAMNLTIDALNESEAKKWHKRYRSTYGQ